MSMASEVRHGCEMGWALFSGESLEKSIKKPPSSLTSIPKEAILYSLKINVVCPLRDFGIYKEF